ncbi:MAG TPA: hypothetical protein VMG08_14065 [Allosphingosinicella sp.]|nr:hypothetical protein [Allosphingosinicella sp.]
MRGAAATAGMLSAAILLAPGCERRPEPRNSKEEPVRRAAYLTALARELLDTCPAGATPVGEAARYEELKRLAAQTGAGHALWLGENDAAAIRRVSAGERCGAGEAPRRAALGAYSRSLDSLAGRIAEYRP